MQSLASERDRQAEIQPLGRELERLFEQEAEFRDAPELGAWDLKHSPRLEFINGDAWFAEVGFDTSAGQPIRIKFVVLRPDGQEPVYEDLVCRTFLLPEEGSVKLDFDWNLR